MDSCSCSHPQKYYLHLGKERYNHSDTMRDEIGSPAVLWYGRAAAGGDTPQRSKSISCPEKASVYHTALEMMKESAQQVSVISVRFRTATRSDPEFFQKHDGGRHTYPGGCRSRRDGPGLPVLHKCGNCHAVCNYRKTGNKSAGSAGPFTKR